jgi:probable rRNA maturation factor
MTHLATSEAILAEETEPPARRLQVEVTNETGAPVDAARLEAGVAAALESDDRRPASVSVAIVGDAAIHELNRRFLAHDYATDVLTFTLEDDRESLEGEIVASLDTARREAAAAGWSAADELLLYVVHGALHLAGYDDATPADAALMRWAEAQVLDRLGVTRADGDPRWRFADDPPGDEEAPHL